MKNFPELLNDILNFGALNLAISIGYRLKIFETMEALNRFVSADEIADAAGLNPRYVKEWLGVVSTGGVVELTLGKDGHEIYYLPPDHAAVLTRNAGGSNMGMYTQEIPMLTACAMEEVVKGFQAGNGVPFSFYPEFQNFMAELSDAKQEGLLVNQFLPSIENGDLVRRLESGIAVCDLGCGQGVSVNLMAESFPKSRFTGIDNHEEAIFHARASAEEKGLTNAQFQIMDAAETGHDISVKGKFDYICAFDAIHDQSHPLEALKGIKHMLAPGGIFSMVDIKASTRQLDNLNHPMAPFLYTVSLMHCMPVGLNDNGTGLGMMWGKEQATELLREAGFETVTIVEMPYDSFNMHFLCS